MRSLRRSRLLPVSSTTRIPDAGGAESGPTPIDDRSFHEHRMVRRTSSTAPTRPLVPMTAVVSALLLVLAATPSSLLVAAQETDGGGGGTCPQPAPTCATTYYKISDEANGLATSCAAVDQTADPVVGLDQNGCQAACDGLAGCDTINFRWVDPNFGGQTTCYRKNCGSFQTAACTLFSKHKERDVYTKACGAEDLWSDYVLGGSFDGLFAGVLCPDESSQRVSEIMGRCTASAGVEPEAVEETCSTRYYKLTDEFNGQTSTCPTADGASVAEPLLDLDQSACQAACDDLASCDTIEYRWRDPTYEGRSACYLRACGDFDAATCSLTLGPGRDVYTKACGADAAWSDQILTDANGLFAAVQCTVELETPPPAPEVQAVASDYVPVDCTDFDEKADQEEPICVDKYYKISDESNGLATSCAAVDQTADPVIGLDQAGCQAACDSLEGCDTINFRWKDPNFQGESTCYRKNCGSFETAACTLFSKHKSRDVYTKACGSKELWADHVLIDGDGLFAGVRCPTEVEEIQTSGAGDEGPRVCTSFISTNRTNSQCDVCGEWSGGGQDSAAASVRTCLIWEKTSANGIASCKEYAPSALQLQQRAEYNKFLQSRWSEVGVCNGSYIRGTTCEITLEDGSVCEVRDQPCHGGTELGGVAGVLSAGWQMTFGTAEDNHVCTMCGRGTFGSCDDACAYRRNFFWSGYNLGSIEVDMNAAQVQELLAAFIAAQPDETYQIPQTLELIPDVLDGLSGDHPLSVDNLPSQSIYSIISVDEVLVTVRDQLNLVAVGLKNSQRSGDEQDDQLAYTVLSTSGVKVYETCQCIKCPRGQFQDGLGETSCKSCDAILPGSDTSDTGADGPELCQCLASNDVFLSSDGTRCISCDSVRSGDAAAPQGVCQCGADTHEMDASVLFPTEPDDWITCSPCPQGSTTFNAVTKTFDYGESIDNCFCAPGTYGSSGDCSSCPVLQTSPPDAQSADECQLTDAALLMAIVIPTGIIVFGVLLGLINLRFKKKIAKLEAEKRRQMQEKVNEATETVNHLAHPMVFVTAEWFLNAGRMIKHEDARTKHCLFTVDTMEELKGFKKGNTFIFFSHQWLAWSEPDPEDLQYNAMISALKELKEAKNLSLSNTYIWLDYTSIPQTHRGLQRLSINSLTNYAGACDYFVIVAPGETDHKDTGTLCDKISYQERTWCRAEQLAHGCRRGVENMYLTADGGGLEPLTWDWIKASFQIFNGRLTCCARGHVGMEQCDQEYLVTPVLGLYCELLAADKMKVLPADQKEVLTYMKEHEDTMFPHSFSFSNSDGKQPEDRELFGDILSLLDELNLKSEDDDEPGPSVETDDPQSTDEKRPSGSENTRTPSDSSGDNVHPSKDVADSAVEVHDKV
mmetsp:Transcript_3887/g.9103  ORF Transcript_3887/g.9103 Transcript_3887/m.9103 type:complete len:1377 (+) Transcript_3887:260-4390(+)